LQAIVNIFIFIKINYLSSYNEFNTLTDHRKRSSYSMTELVMGVLFMFILKEKSRNSYDSLKEEENFRDNIYHYFKFRLPHPDTSDELLRHIPAHELEAIKATLVSGLIEQKVFANFRFLNTTYLVAVDGTGIATFEEKHCEHCLTKTSKNGVTNYYHHVLESKLITSSGLAISLATEFIENPLAAYEKQDCEQKAFVRLAEKIKKYFPRLPICILADGLYPNNTVFNICEKNNWKFIITLKDGCLKTFHKEAELLKATAQSRRVYREEKTKNTTLDYAYINNIEYGERTFSWIECNETTVFLNSKSTSCQRFVYITNVIQNNDIIITTADSGRLRWKIENEGFNTQKNLGYDLEHKYSRVSYIAMQNYYQLLQIAHMINQFVQQSKEFIALITERSKQTITNLWKKMIAYLIIHQYHAPDIESIETG
jgi:hypothetical protein